jgi:uncharacterized phage-associated protein
MCKVTDIAKYFIKKGIDDGDPITQLKLQKIIYIAHGFHLAIKEKELFKEKIKAWKFGPVVPELYKIYSIYGNSPIDNSFEFLTGSLENFNIDNDKISLLDQVWNITKNLNTTQLVNWTHAKDGPWYKYYKEGELDTVLPNDEIKEYFKKFVKKEDGSKDRV